MLKLEGKTKIIIKNCIRKMRKKRIEELPERLLNYFLISRHEIRGHFQKKPNNFVKDIQVIQLKKVLNCFLATLSSYFEIMTSSSFTFYCNGLLKRFLTNRDFAT